MFLASLWKINGWKCSTNLNGRHPRPPAHFAPHCRCTGGGARVRGSEGRGSGGGGGSLPGALGRPALVYSLTPSCTEGLKPPSLHTRTARLRTSNLPRVTKPRGGRLTICWGVVTSKGLSKIPYHWTTQSGGKWGTRMEEWRRGEKSQPTWLWQGEKRSPEYQVLIPGTCKYYLTGERRSLRR